jgi:nitroreductase
MASKIKKYIPRQVYDALRKAFLVKQLLSEYIRDFKRYLEHSSILAVKTDSQLLGRISATYHVVEKGLSMPEKRMGFGGDNIITLCELIRQAFEKGLREAIEVKSAIASIKQYHDEHRSNQLSEPVRIALESVKEYFQEEHSEHGGSKSLTSNELLKNWGIDFKKFISTRHSIRHYSPKEVDLSLIVEAIEMANYSPSVCNRQSTRAIIINEKEKIEQALKFQNGNRGFGHLAKVLIIVMSDLSSFHEYQERNQCFIDSGLFSMSLLYSLQSMGLGACPLNWCTDGKTDDLLKKALNISENKVITMMISVGHLPKSLEVAVSKRKKGRSLIINPQH